MQVNTRFGHDAATARLTALSIDVDRLQASISSGKRIAVAADDPIGAARVLGIDRTIAATAGQQSSIDRAASRLSRTDDALDGATQVFVRAREIALAAGNATYNAADRATFANEVAQLSDQLLAYANARDSDGASLFGGARTAGAAYAADTGGAVTWAGAGTARVLVVDSGSIPTGVDGPQVFDGLPGAPLSDGTATTTDAFAMLAALQAALGEPDTTRRNASLATAQTGLDAATSRTADTRATVGTRLARLDAETARLDRNAVALEKDKSAVEGLDTTEAIARLQRLSVVLQAAQLGFTRVANLSLWDYLR